MNEDALFISDNRRPANRWGAFTEAEDQRAVFEWAALSLGKYPELGLLFHIPNGGYRNGKEGANLKRQGVRKGVPDLFLPVARGIYHGLFVEMKTPKGRLAPEQKGWINALIAQGYRAAVAWGYEDAVSIIEGYLNDD